MQLFHDSCDKEVCFILFSSDQHHLVLHVGGLPLSEGAEWAAWIAKRGQSGKQVGDDLNMMIMMIMLHDDHNDLLFFHENIILGEKQRDWLQSMVSCTARPGQIFVLLSAQKPFSQKANLLSSGWTPWTPWMS